MGPCHPHAPFNLVFCDPPYRKGLGEKALASARAGGWIVPGALIIFEEAADADVALPDGFEELERRVYGDTQIVIGRTH
jgi:16S rRNA (guanine966-N2)-methyltransferase